MNTNNPSNATINAFSAGYRATDAVLNTASAVTGNTKDAAVAAGHTVTGFFSGMRYAIAQRRGTKPVIVKDNEAKRREREELYRRAHAAQQPGTKVIILGHEGAK